MMKYIIRGFSATVLLMVITGLLIIVSIFTLGVEISAFPYLFGCRDFDIYYIAQIDFMARNFGFFAMPYIPAFTYLLLLNIFGEKPYVTYYLLRDGKDDFIPFYAKGIARAIGAVTIFAAVSLPLYLGYTRPAFKIQASICSSLLFYAKFAGVASVIICIIVFMAHLIVPTAWLKNNNAAKLTLTSSPNAQQDRLDANSSWLVSWLVRIITVLIVIFSKLFAVIIGLGVWFVIALPIWVALLAKACIIFAYLNLVQALERGYVASNYISVIEYTASIWPDGLVRIIMLLFPPYKRSQQQGAEWQAYIDLKKHFRWEYIANVLWVFPFYGLVAAVIMIITSYTS